MPKTLKKRKPKPSPDQEKPEQNGFGNLQDVANVLTRKLEFHFTHDKDSERAVDPAECQELLQARLKRLEQDTLS
ncbi:hypothetical protein AK812_SmicGene39555 [Symbiodinium microadriaticum]|uniref:Uncharacterized protein n=1 Tax=Symbiodinium microadriaticum TaxID=2951 RepID=A0A1Q9CAY4_SYMMI|nr:hypothetical protein AK812_SmicGene39555 [Symbiodinium microadriaticum]